MHLLFCLGEKKKPKNFLSLLSSMKILQLNVLVPTKFNPAEHSGITALEHSCEKDDII